MTADVDIPGARCRDFFDHWRSLIDTGLMPHSRTYLNNVEPKLIPMVQISEVTESGQRVRFMGTGLVELIGEDHTNTIIGADLPPELKREFDSRAFVVIDQPCGLNEVAAFTRSSGQTFRMETVILPLAVDSGKAPRYCSYSAVVEPLEHDKDDPTVQYNETALNRWIDIGNGVPEITPDTPTTG